MGRNQILGNQKNEIIKYKETIFEKLDKYKEIPKNKQNNKQLENSKLVIIKKANGDIALIRKKL